MRFTLLAWAALSSFLSAAGLTFPEVQKEIHAEADATVITVDFPFTNKTGKAVEIKRYDASCSCMSAGVESGKLRYEPGESGVIRTKFDMSNYSGTVDKPVAVWLDDDPEKTPSVQLVVRVHIPEVVKIDTKTVKWDIGAAVTPQTIHLTIEGADPVKIVSISGSNTNFKHELKVVEEGKAYDLVVKPVDTTVPGLAVFRIETDCKIERHKFKQAFGVIRRPIPGEAAQAKP